jgi:hypothetical protein
MWRSVWELSGVPLSPDDRRGRTKRPFARTENCSDYWGKYLILLVNSRHIRGGYCLARVAAEAPTLRQIALKHYAK